MLNGFNQYVNEAIGANSMERDPIDMIVSPDIKQSGSLMFNTGLSGSIPAHWNNSPFLSGGRSTSAFGLNPKKSKKKTVLSYYEFIKVAKSKSR